MKQLVISIGREFGSGGHVIAEDLANRFGLKLYDKNILSEIAEWHGTDAEQFHKFDEVPKSKFLSRTVRGLSNSPEEIISEMQFNFIKRKAESGESFVIVGRCAETVLKGNPSLVSVFILADYDKKVQRVCEKYELSVREAQQLMKHTDKKRKSYHNLNCDIKWGDSRNYDLCINSSRLGLHDTADLIEEYVRRRHLMD